MIAESGGRSQSVLINLFLIAILKKKEGS